MKSAKRLGPEAVNPVTHQGIRYEVLLRTKQNNLPQSGGMVAAIDIASGQQLWMVQLYQIVYDDSKEKDVQEVYIRDLTLGADAEVLIATDERKRRWQLNLSDRSVSQLPNP